MRKSRDVPQGTAEGLLAKVYLFRGDYANVKKYTGQVIARGEYSLHPDYRDLFNPNSYYSDEVMLADQYLWGESTERNLESEYVKWQGIRGVMGWGCSLLPKPSTKPMKQEIRDVRQPSSTMERHWRERARSISRKKCRPVPTKRPSGLPVTGTRIRLPNRIAT